MGELRQRKILGRIKYRMSGPEAGGSTVVELSSHHPMVKSSSPAAGTIKVMENRLNILTVD